MTISARRIIYSRIDSCGAPSGRTLRGLCNIFTRLGLLTLCKKEPYSTLYGSFYLKQADMLCARISALHGRTRHRIPLPPTCFPRCLYQCMHRLPSKPLYLFSLRWQMFFVILRYGESQKRGAVLKAGLRRVYTAMNYFSFLFCSGDTSA